MPPSGPQQRPEQPADDPAERAGPAAGAPPPEGASSSGPPSPAGAVADPGAAPPVLGGALCPAPGGVAEAGGTEGTAASEGVGAAAGLSSPAAVGAFAAGRAGRLPSAEGLAGLPAVVASGSGVHPVAFGHSPYGIRRVTPSWGAASDTPPTDSGAGAGGDASSRVMPIARGSSRKGALESPPMSVATTVVA
ncbi:hypothetical protein [Streptomyces sp. 840.1]|uniref:hypothetical protein n=1 Tax=Streptomyces sp. 840.1 TaxID=2485152 RepID=UPI0011CDC043|nr:hypothetical protein [Streptomyces sp. 840.1]